MKILIVEDDQDVSASLQSYFKKRNVDVSTTGSGREALSIIKVFKPDIVLLDITLSDLNGLEVLKQLRATDRETKVIIITGDIYPEEIERMYYFGISGYRQKPLGLVDVERLIYQVTGHPLKGADDSVKTEENKPYMSVTMAHRLSDFLAIVHDQCDAFTLNAQKGVYKEKSSQELVDMFGEIVKKIKFAADKSMEEQ